MSWSPLALFKLIISFKGETDREEPDSSHSGWNGERKGEDEEEAVKEEGDKPEDDPDGQENGTSCPEALIRSESESEVSKGTATAAKDHQRIAAGLFRSIILVVFVNVEQDVLCVDPGLSDSLGMDESSSKTFHQKAIRAIIASTTREILLVDSVGKVKGHRVFGLGFDQKTQASELWRQEQENGSDLPVSLNNQPAPPQLTEKKKVTEIRRSRIKDEGRRAENEGPFRLVDVF